MKLKSKIGVSMCAVALASMTALPAFAIDLNPEYSDVVGNGSASTDMKIDAEIIPTDKFIKVQVPTKVAVAFRTDAATDNFVQNGFFASAPTITNDASSAGAVKVELSTVADPKGSGNESFLDVAALSLAGNPLTATSTDLVIAASLAKGAPALPMAITSGATTASNFTPFVDGTSHEGLLGIDTQFKVTLIP